MSSDLYRLIWSIALLGTIVGLYLGQAPEVLIASLLPLFPKGPYGSGGEANRPASGQRVNDASQ
jgi:hypothetical protein